MNQILEREKKMKEMEEKDLQDFEYCIYFNNDGDGFYTDDISDMHNPSRCDFGLLLDVVGKWQHSKKVTKQTFIMRNILGIAHQYFNKTKRSSKK